jgi:hypothetical protein
VTVSRETLFTLSPSYLSVLESHGHDTCRRMGQTVGTVTDTSDRGSVCAVDTGDMHRPPEGITDVEYQRITTSDIKI